MRILESEINFYPVGQGLFSTGSVNLNNHRTFHWVYDCGTISSPKLIDEALTRHLSSISNGFTNVKPKIDLVVISHFDKDHISGLLKLLTLCSVDVLLLPYMPLWRRLLLVAEQQVSGRSRTFKFLLDPVGYIRRNAALNINRIVLVPGSGARDLNASEQEADGGEPNQVDQLDTLICPTMAEATMTVEQMEQVRYKNKEDKSQTTVGAEILQKNGRIRIGRIWEFLPYNDTDARSKPPKKFLDNVASQRDKLIKAPTQDNLSALKLIYDTQFGRGSVNRNAISLFLYSGCMLANGLDDSLWSRLYRFIMAESEVIVRTRSAAHDKNQVAVLYTGDGFLDTHASLERLIQYFGKARIEAAYVLQVMHHGSEKNWYPGAAKRLSPWCSVFSSDPDTRNKHPDPVVVRDFLPYRPIQVNRSTGLKITQECWY